MHACVRFFNHTISVSYVCTQALWDKDNIYIVTPFCGGGEVFDAMADRGQFEEVEARPLFRQALAGLLHLKRHGVCHRYVYCTAAAVVVDRRAHT